MTSSVRVTDQSSSVQTAPFVLVWILICTPPDGDQGCIYCLKLIPSIDRPWVLSAGRISRVVPRTHILPVPDHLANRSTRIVGWIYNPAVDDPPPLRSASSQKNGSSGPGALKDSVKGNDVLTAVTDTSSIIHDAICRRSPVITNAQTSMPSLDCA